jgi:hypothetical protein
MVGPIISGKTVCFQYVSSPTSDAFTITDLLTVTYWPEMLARRRAPM